MSTGRRAALYFRQSLDVAEGIERQRERCRALALAREFTVVTEYQDNAVSASKPRGPETGWGRMLEAAKAGEFEIVVAVDLDRLLRTVRDLVTLTDLNLAVVTVDGEIDLASADGEFRATMAAGIARFEARRKGERQKRATTQAAAKGKRIGGRRPFGYQSDGVTVNEAEAEAVALGYRAALTGVALAEIARQWNAQGFVTAQARYKGARDEDGKPVEPSPWTRSAVRGLLLNPRYYGKRSHLGEIVADAEWPGIVDETLWLGVHALLTDPTRRRQATRGRYLLSGLAVCGVCGAPVHAGGNARAGVPGYRCRASMGHFARRAAPVEEYVEAVVVARLSRPDILTLLDEREGVDVGALSVEAKAIRQRLDSMAVEFADGVLTAAQLRKATERMRGNLAEIERSMADAAQSELLAPLLGSADIRATWAAMPVSYRRMVVAALARVTLHPVGRGRRIFDPATVGIEWANSRP